MADRSEIEISQQADELTLDIEQYPPIEGLSHYSVKGKLVGDLVFQTGSIFAVLEVVDVFSMPRRVQLHHNGHDRTWIALQTRASVQLRLLSFDGVRLRLRYRQGNGYYGTVLYLQRPSSLYALGECEDFPKDIEAGGVEKKMCIRGVRPLRTLERLMTRHGNNYETGRLGAEITYTIASEKLGVKDLILNEPARGGTDVYTRDRRVLVESRFMVKVEPASLKGQLSRDLAQMTRKIRRDFRRNPGAEVGYAVISFLDHGRIDSLVVEVSPQR